MARGWSQRTNRLSKKQKLSGRDFYRLMATRAVHKDADGGWLTGVLVMTLLALRSKASPSQQHAVALELGSPQAFWVFQSHARYPQTLGTPSRPARRDHTWLGYEQASGSQTSKLGCLGLQLWSQRSQGTGAKYVLRTMLR